MTTFAEAEIIQAGTSSATPARDYIVAAGDSSTTPRDFVVKYVRYVLTALSASLSLSSSTVPTWSQTTSTTSVLSSQAQFLYALRCLVLLRALLSASSSTANITPVNIARDAINVTSGTVNFFNQQSSSISVLGGVWQVFRINLGTGVVQVVSVAPSPGLPETGYVYLSTTPVDFKYLFRIWSIITHTLQVSGRIDQWSLGSSTIQVSSSSSNLSYKKRIATLQQSTVRILSRPLNIIIQKLESLRLGVSSTPTSLQYQRTYTLVSSLIKVSSSLTNIKDMKLGAFTSYVSVSSGSLEMRLLPSGVLPGFIPASRSFSAASYPITKSTAMAGRVVRRLMTSKPTDSTLSLEYVNVPDADARQVVENFDTSYGTFYGFDLPSTVLEGAGNDLRTYLSVAGSTLRWYYAERPVIRSVSKGLSNVQVELKAKVKAQ